MYDITIIGCGPAGMTSALYSARKKLSTLLISKDMGGQMMLTGRIENWMGFQRISGYELTRMFEEHLNEYPEIEIALDEFVKTIIPGNGFFEVLTESEKRLETRTIIIATGKRSKPLGVPGEKELSGKGISYCATCDAPIYAEREVAVVGGGNSALQAVIDLLPIAHKIHVVNFIPGWQADPILLERINENPKVISYLGWEVTALTGDTHIKGMKIRHVETGKEKEIGIEGMFVEVGLIPNSEFVQDVVQLNNSGEIIVDCLSRTDVPGIFAAGDVTSIPTKQLVTAAGEGAKAALSAYDYFIMNNFWTGRAMSIDW